MLIHPWDAALDPAEWRDWLASTDRFGMLAVNNRDPAHAHAPLVVPTHFTLAGDELRIHLARPTRSAITWKRPTRCVWRWRVTTPTSLPTGGTRQVGPAKMVCRPATTAPCSSTADPLWSTTRTLKLRFSTRSAPTCGPRAATRPWRATAGPYWRMLPGGSFWVGTRPGIEVLRRIDPRRSARVAVNEDVRQGGVRRSGMLAPRVVIAAIWTDVRGLL